MLNIENNELSSIHKDPVILQQNTRTVSRPQKRNIPTPPFGMLLVGSTQQGKTTMLKKLLRDPQYYGPAPNKDKRGRYFDLVIIFSDSLEVEDEYDDFQEGTRVQKFHPDDFEEVVESVKKQQTGYLKDKSRRKLAPSICIIIDDCIHKKIFQYRGDLCEWLYTVARHLYITPIITTQYLKAVSPMIRANSMLTLLFKTFDLAETEKFMHSFVFKRDRDLIRERLPEIYNENYAFIACIPSNQYNDRLLINFEERLL